MQIAGEDQIRILELHLGEHILAVQRGGEVVVHGTGGGQGKHEIAVLGCRGRVFQLPRKVAGRFIAAVVGRAFLARALRQHHVVPRLNERIGGDIVPNGLLTQDRGFRQVFGLDAFGHFFVGVDFQFQFALFLFRAPDGLHGIVVGLRDAAVRALKIRHRAVQVNPQERNRRDQQRDEQQGPREAFEMPVERPEQAGFSRRIAGGGRWQKCGEEHRQQSGGQEECDQRFDIGEVGGATHQSEQDWFHDR